MSILLIALLDLLAAIGAIIAVLTGQPVTETIGTDLTSIL